MSSVSLAKSSGLMIVATVLAALGWLFSLKAIDGLPPMFFIGIRFLVAGLIVAGVGFAETRRFDLGDLAVAAIPGVFMAASMILWIQGLRHADNLGVSSFISSLGNILAPVTGRVLYRWRVPGSTWVAGATSLVGMGFLFLESGFVPSVADWFFLGSALASSLSFVFNTRYAATMPVLTLTAVQLMVTGGASLIASSQAEVWPAVTPGAVTLGWLAASILLATSLRFFLQLKAQSLAPIGHTAILMCLEPVWTTLIAAEWLGTGMSGRQTIGCSLIFAALLINQWKTARGFIANGRG